MEKTETRTAFSLLVDGQGVSLGSSGGVFRIELTVGGPEGEWWGRNCTRGDIAKMADAIHTAAYANVAIRCDVDCGDGYILSASPRIVREERPLVGSVSTDFVELLGCDSFGAGAVLMLPKIMAEALSWALWAAIERAEPATES